MHQPLQQPLQKSPNQTNNDCCFRCKKPGHWARNCLESPSKSPNPKSNKSPIFHPTSTSDFPATHCPCGAGLCEILVSQSANNPGRQYYCCPGKYEYRCDHFQWCNQLKREEILEVRPAPYPFCGCGAGVCKVLKENGLSYFVCPIEKGYGACNFRQLKEADQELHTLSPEAEMQIDDVVNRSLAKRALDFSSEVVQVQMEDGVDWSSATTRGMSPLSSDTIRSVDNNITVNELDSEMKTDLPNMVDSLVENVEASVTTFIVPCENQDKTSSDGRLKLDELLPKQTALMRYGQNEGHFVTDSILQASEKVAHCSLNDLITLLESVGSPAALNCLPVDVNLLHLLLIEYIQQVTALSCIEQAIKDDTSMILPDHNKNVKACYEEIFHAFCEAGKAYMASNERLISLRENASCGGDMFDYLDDKIWCCEVENDRKRDKLLQITKTMSQCMQ